EAGNEDVAARCPDPMDRGPNPVRPRNGPVSWLPSIAGVVNIVAGNPKIVVARLRTARAVFERFWRGFGNICHLLVLGGSPESRSPLESASCWAPVAGHPSLSGRNIAPHSADPQKIVAVVIPGPIA